MVRRGTNELGMSFVGFRDAWRGVMERDVMPLDISKVRGILPKGGTILGTSRANPYLIDGGVEAIRETIEELRLDGMIVIGGEGSMTLAHRLIEEIGLKVIGVPKTIDNDIVGTDRTFGFDTAVHVASEAIDRLHTTTESHHRVAIVEVMGRSVGWIAVHAGLAGGANGILIPEVPLDAELWDKLNGWITSRFETHYSPIIVVAEGVQPERRPARRWRRPGSTTSAVRATAASGRRSRPSSRRSTATRCAPRRSATSSAAAPRPRTTGCSPPGSGSTRCSPPPRATGARWSRCGTRTSSGCRSREVAGRTRTVPRSLYDEASVFFG